MSKDRLDCFGHGTFHGNKPYERITDFNQTVIKMFVSNSKTEEGSFLSNSSEISIIIIIIEISDLFERKLPSSSYWKKNASW